MEIEICLENVITLQVGLKTQLSATFFFYWRYNPHWGLYFISF